MNALGYDFANAPAQALTTAPAAPHDLRPHVTIRGLSKRFGKTVIYDAFDLDLPRGELITVFGPNGCGKRSLINMIGGLIGREEGEGGWGAVQLEAGQVSSG